MKSFPRANGTCAYGLIGALLIAGASPAWATTPCAPVTSTDDSSNAAATAGTLRYAINQGNQGVCDTVHITATGTITLTQGQLEISNTTNPITVTGPGAANLTISANNSSRVLRIDQAVAASISGVTVANGYDRFAGGGIYNGGTLTVSNSTFSGNSGYSGGGIANGGTLTVSNSTFSGNSGSYGSGIANLDQATLTVSNSTFLANSARYDSVPGSGSGGGIYSGVSMLRVSNSTFSGNSGYSGGGIASNGVLLVSNSTFSANGGGGIYNNGTWVVKSTILANNLGGNCMNFGPWGSAGYNLSDDSSCAAYFNQPSDLHGTPAGLDPRGLQDNGGPTQTIALQPNSAAVDAIPMSQCTDVSGFPVLTDQRGVSRPQPAGGKCDIGAFELVQTTPFALFTPNLEISTGAVSAAGFQVNIAFMLGSKNTAIFPLSNPVVLTVGTYTVTVPAAEFKLIIGGSGGYAYSGTINGVQVSARLSQIASNTYSLRVEVTGVVPASTNPVPVTLTIGTDSSATRVTARIE